MLPTGKDSSAEKFPQTWQTFHRENQAEADYHHVTDLQENKEWSRVYSKRRGKIKQLHQIYRERLGLKDVIFSQLVL